MTLDKYEVMSLFRRALKTADDYGGTFPSQALVAVQRAKELLEKYIEICVAEDAAAEAAKAK